MDTKFKIYCRNSRRTVHVGEAVDDLVPAGQSEHAVLATSELLPASQGVQNTEFCCDV